MCNVVDIFLVTYAINMRFGLKNMCAVMLVIWWMPVIHVRHIYAYTFSIYAHQVYGTYGICVQLAMFVSGTCMWVCLFLAHIWQSVCSWHMYGSKM